MGNMFDTTISRKTKRGTPRVVGYYTSQEAADVLGVDTATLKYRRDHGDANTLWSIRGIAETNPLFDMLSESHKIINGYHYYERKLFKKFVKEYNSRPKVQAARARQQRFPDAKSIKLSLRCTTRQELKRYVAILEKLLQADGEISIKVY